MPAKQLNLLSKVPTHGPTGYMIVVNVSASSYGVGVGLFTWKPVSVGNLSESMDQ